MSIGVDIDGIARLCERPATEGDYLKDGLLHCGKCNTPKQCRHMVLDELRVLPCLCACGAALHRETEAKAREAEAMARVIQLKTQGIQDKQIRGWTFANDDGCDPGTTDKAMRYFTKWKQMYEENIGLLLWGNVGTGKTFFAACIANALLECNVPVLMTNFAKIINALSGFGDSDKNEYISSINRYKLLVIDDLGAERQSEYAQEIVYSVIDARYKNGQPLILTTNMTIDEIKTPKNITCSRIYDRIIEMCVPIEFKGESRRKAVYHDKISRAKAMFE